MNKTKSFSKPLPFAALLFLALPAGAGPLRLPARAVKAPLSPAALPRIARSASPAPNLGAFAAALRSPASAASAALAPAPATAPTAPRAEAAAAAAPWERLPAAWRALPGALARARDAGELERVLRRAWGEADRGDWGGPSFSVNYEGVPVHGRAAEYYALVKALVEELKDRHDLSESLDVMDDSYGDVWAKIKGLEALAEPRRVSWHNTHLKGTLTWVDGVLEEKGRRTAIHTQRVFFHRSPNPRSEIAEGIRRLGPVLEELGGQFARHGQAERALGRLDEGVLVFDTRGYGEIKEFLKAREAEFKAKYGKHLRFAYLDELAPPPPASVEALREDLRRLIRKYRGEGVSKIIEGVIYSRYVGLLLELRTIEELLNGGYRILQSGRELRTEDEMYITELDVVARAPDGRVYIVESKSSRVPLPKERVLQDKVVYKLETYRKHWERIREKLGGRVDGVIFAIDPGGNGGLAPYLLAKREELIARYGMPVEFLFIESVPRGR